MAVCSMKAGTAQQFAPQIGTGLVWIVNDGTGANHASNVAGALGDWRLYAGKALQAAGNRSKERECRSAINNNAA